ncbi:LysR family transcriptional regulator [Epibacterium ulvae]|uniref:LysR family transcriptional regulator n=1 Tax=Epibacterium ulvae TaxID=1156985 RepID=UPI0024900E0F|nr:LysR family transcriptional regulator [Epibacterium ulvae]
MDQLKPDIWRDLAVLLAVGEAESSFGASRLLGISNDAVEMRVDQLETRIGAALVNRSTPRWVLTDAGKGLVQKTRSIVNLIERGTVGEGADKNAPVPLVLSCPDLFFEFLLLPLWYRVETKLPDIPIKLKTLQEVTAKPDSTCDLALYLGRAGQADTVGTKIGDVRFALYAHRSLLGSNARANTPSHFTVESAELNVPDLVWPGGKTTRRVVCNDLLSVVTAVKSGRGIGLLPRFIGDNDPVLVPLEGADVTPLTLSILSMGGNAAKPEVQTLRTLLAREIAQVLDDRTIGAQQG